MDTEELPLVCDNGSGSIKAGFFKDMCPRVRVPTVTARAASSASAGPSGVVAVGEAALEAQHAGCKLVRPIVGGVVQHWDDLELLWDHVFRAKLRVDTDDRSILLADPPLAPVHLKQRLLEVLFEKFRFGVVGIKNSAVLALCSQGKSTGLVVDSGATSTTIVPVFDYVADPAHARRVGVAGDDVTARLCQLMQRSGTHAAGVQDAAMERLKERCCYTAVDVQRETALARDTTCCSTSYTLPDGQVVRVAQQRFLAPEILFEPHLTGVEGKGLARTVFDCIWGLPIDARLGMFKSVLIVGGSIMFPGMSTRLERELRHLYEEHVRKGRGEGENKLRVVVEDLPLRQHMAYTGAAMYADIFLEDERTAVTREEWLEDPQGALRKCCDGLGLQR